MQVLEFTYNRQITINHRKCGLWAANDLKKLWFWVEKWVWILFSGVHSGGIIWGSVDKNSLNECRSCPFTRATNFCNSLYIKALPNVGRDDPDTKIWHTIAKTDNIVEINTITQLNTSNPYFSRAASTRLWPSSTPHQASTLFPLRSIM